MKGFIEVDANKLKTLCEEALSIIHEKQKARTEFLDRECKKDFYYFFGLFKRNFKSDSEKRFFIMELHNWSLNYYAYMISDLEDLLLVANSSATGLVNLSLYCWTELNNFVYDSSKFNYALFSNY